MHAPTLKLERGWCVVNNWTLFMHVMTGDDNDEWMNDYRKQNAMATVFTIVQTRLTQSTWLIDNCLFTYGMTCWCARAIYHSKTGKVVKVLPTLQGVVGRYVTGELEVWRASEMWDVSSRTLVAAYDSLLLYVLFNCVNYFCYYCVLI